MASSTKLTSYQSTTGNGILYLTPVFTYEICVYRVFKKYVELVFRSMKYSTTYLELKNEVKYKKYKKFTQMTCIELYGAPKYYLESNGYKVISQEEYKELVTKKFKRKKKHGN